MAASLALNYIPPKNELNDKWDALYDYPDDDSITAGITLSTDGVLPNESWWDQFGDKTLSALVNEALVSNHDLKMAQARIAEMRADARYASAQLYPQINSIGSVSRATLNSVGSNKVDTTRQAGLSGDWDIDFFGKNVHRNEAAMASVEASEEDFAQGKLNLIADVARNYSHLRAAQQQRELTLRNLRTQRNTLRVTRALREAQDVTELDLAHVEAQIAATEARLPQFRTDEKAAINRITVLTGQQPGALRQLLLPKMPMLALPQDIIVLAPLATIQQRPDVHAAERRLAQTSALSNSAFAALFPKILISGFFGANHSDTFGRLPSWSATANAILPLLDFGRIRTQINSADARQEQAFHTYNQAVLIALVDTENNLNAYIDERKRSVLLKHVVIKQARALNIAREQYKGGIVSQLDLLDTERNHLDAENSWVLSQRTATDNLIGVYHSLGQSPTAP